MEYEYEAEAEESYRASLIKSFKRQVDEGFFPFIIIDCINSHISHFSEIASYAKRQGFEVCMCPGVLWDVEFCVVTTLCIVVCVGAIFFHLLFLRCTSGSSRWTCACLIAGTHTTTPRNTSLKLFRAGNPHHQATPRLTSPRWPRMQR